MVYEYIAKNRGCGHDNCSCVRHNHVLQYCETLVVTVTTSVGESQVMKSKVLLSWIGHHDFWGMAEVLGGEVGLLVYEKIGPDPRSPGTAAAGPGPVRTLVDALKFRKVNLISNYAPELGEAYRRWLDSPTEVHHVNLGNPTNYRDVFRAASSVFEKVHKSLKSHDQLCVHLSPGTPTMTAVSLLLAKTRFPATLYQTHRGNVQEEDLPFDIAVDFLPELPRDTDRNLQFLASRVPGEVEGFESIIGHSRPIRLAVGRAERAAIRDITVPAPRYPDLPLRPRAEPGLAGLRSEVVGCSQAKAGLGLACCWPRSESGGSFPARRGRGHTTAWGAITPGGGFFGCRSIHASRRG